MRRGSCSLGARKRSFHRISKELPPKNPSLLDRVLDARRRSLSWRVRCERCDWVEDAGNEKDAEELRAMHEQGHERRGIRAKIKVHPLPLWRRFLDGVFENADD